MVIGFAGGKTAFFTAALLYATLPQAQMMASDSESGDRPKASMGLTSDVRATCSIQASIYVDGQPSFLPLIHCEGGHGDSQW